MEEKAGIIIEQEYQEFMRYIKDFLLDFLIHLNKKTGGDIFLKIRTS
jgi:hypothetical protein